MCCARGEVLITASGKTDSEHLPFGTDGGRLKESQGGLALVRTAGKQMEAEVKSAKSLVSGSHPFSTKE